MRVRLAPELLSMSCRGEGRREWAPGTARLAVLSPPLSPTSSHWFPFRSWAGALRQGNKSNFPPSHCHLLGFHTLGVSGGRGPLPLSQCLRCAPSAPPGPGILCAARSDRAQELEGVGGLRQLEEELSGKGPVLAAGREFDGLLCGPRGFSLIPLCVLACSPLTLSDKLLSRRLPVPGKKRQRSRASSKSLASGPWGRQELGSESGAWGGGGVLLPSVQPFFFRTLPSRWRGCMLGRVFGCLGEPYKVSVWGISADRCLFYRVGWGRADPHFFGSLSPRIKD